MAHHSTAAGPRVTCETSKVLLADGQVVFFRDLPFSPHVAIGSRNNLDEPKTKIEKY